MIACELVYAAPLVAEKLGLRWASAILSPCSFLSAHDPSLLVNISALYRLRTAGWRINRLALDLGRLATRHWWDPVRELRRDLGLRIECDPLVRDKFSPHLVLALFSRHLAQPQPDWPAQTVQPGFASSTSRMQIHIPRSKWRHFSLPEMRPLSSRWALRLCTIPAIFMKSAWKQRTGWAAARYCSARTPQSAPPASSRCPTRRIHRSFLTRRSSCIRAAPEPQARACAPDVPCFMCPTAGTSQTMVFASSVSARDCVYLERNILKTRHPPCAVAQPATVCDKGRGPGRAGAAGRRTERSLQRY
jgi:hypothetical protein